MKGIVAANTLDEFVSEIVARYKYITPDQNGHNALGFNSDPIRTEADICYYGCSITHGHGVDSNQRWTDIIDSKKGYLSNNFGISGACIDDILSVFVATTKFVKIKKALFLLPDYVRQTIRVEPDDQYDPRYINIFPNLVNLANHPWLALPELYYADRAQSSINLITYIAKINNIDVYFSSWTSEVFELLPADKKTKTWHKNDQLGTDNRHPGPKFHSDVADQFIELL